MLSVRLFALVAIAVAAISPPRVLQVLRSSPNGEAEPTASIMVTFDRPVAGSLDRTVDAASILRIDPSIDARIEWRDPVTIRVLPTKPLKPGTTYTVTVSNNFAAMDGSRLPEPFEYSFEVTGPRALTGLPVSEGEHPRFLGPDATFEVVFSAPLEVSSPRNLAYLDFDKACKNGGITRLAISGQRAINDKDPWQYREAGGWNRDKMGDALRRVVVFTPEKKLPYDCAGDLVVPSVVDPEGTKPFLRWTFHTYGPFNLTGASCSSSPYCPTGGVHLSFSTPVKGAQVQRWIRLRPDVPFEVSDTSEEAPEWYLEATLKPNTGYTVSTDTSLRDVFGQRLAASPTASFATTGFAPLVEYEYGSLTIERAAFRTLAVKYVNVDTLTAEIAPVPAALEARVLQYNRWDRRDSTVAHLLAGATRRAIAVTGAKDRVRIYGLKIPLYNAQRPGAATLQVVRITSPGLNDRWNQEMPVAIIQATDLAVHARIGFSDGVVWVTGVNDGKPRPGAAVVLYDAKGIRRAFAISNADGVATLPSFRPDTTSDGGYSSFEGYVAATLGNDRAITTVSRYDPDLSSWRFNVRTAWGSDRVPATGAVFTERGIYRPGESLYAKAIVRTGPLGKLGVPARGDSLKWVFDDRDGGTLREKVVGLSSFGTSDQRLSLPAGLALGSYNVRIQLRRAGRWMDMATTSYRVAEYRPPEFLVDVTSDSSARFPGDSMTARVEARYLFGAPMGRAALSWVARQASLESWELQIPGTEGYYVGENGWWYEDYATLNTVAITAQGVDTLDAQGHAALSVALAEPAKGRAARATIEATVTDVNRQTVSAAASVVIHPAEFYLAAKPVGASYFWTAGARQQIAVLAVKPDGKRVPGVKVQGVITRREWHQVHRERGGYSEVYGEWVSDTVGNCGLTTENDPVACNFTPSAGGTYIVSLDASDTHGRAVSTSLYRWATGKDWVPWNDESQFKMDLVPDRTRYAVGDTATVLVASPFTDAEAWVTVEREGLLEQRRLRITAGSTTLKFLITEAYAPNAFVSVLVARGRSAPPGPLDDPGRPTIRVGYAELRVTPEVKRLTVAVTPELKEYRPGDTAQLRLQVTDRQGQGSPAEVTLWAVDQGILALTGYKTPDPIDLLYAPRGLGMRLASNLTTVAPQVPEGEKGGRAPGGGGGLGQSDVLRSRFKATAFFLGSVVTDARGSAIARPKLPDNLTTFRVMAVAVTAGDRYGSGESPLLVSRPLLARPALPRFVRNGDRFSAGVVVNQRAGGTPAVTVRAESQGSTLGSDPVQKTTLEAGRGREVRFDFRQPGTSPLGSNDSVTFRFGVTGAGDSDAVQQRLALKPNFRPRAWTIAGIVADTATAVFELPGELDPDRSRLDLSLGTSPLAAIKGLDYTLRVYPYGCTEQVSSTAQPLIALYRAQKQLKLTLLKGDPRGEIEAAVAVLVARQRADGGIGYWGSSDWSTPWLSAYAGITLLDARAAGVSVDQRVFSRLAEYLRTNLHQPADLRAPVVGWYEAMQTALSDQVAAADFLSRLGKADVAAENELLRGAAQLGWEDRARLAEVLARRRAFKAAKSLLAPTWASVKVEGRRAIVPEMALPRYHYFYSHVRPTARLLVATLAVDSTNSLIGPLVETLVQQGRAGVLEPWNTQDYAAAVTGLVAFERRVRGAAGRGFTVKSGGRTLLAAAPGRPLGDSTVTLTGLTSAAPDGRQRLSLSLGAGGTGSPVFYYLTVREVPRIRPVNPEDEGIQVERWYEGLTDKRPLTSIKEGELIRVRLRITVPDDRQFVVLEDALPAGLEAVDLSLRTTGGVPGPGVNERNDYLAAESAMDEDEGDESAENPWYYGSWDNGWWSPFDHSEMRDDRVVYFATVLWKGEYTASYLARATTPGVFTRPPAHAEEMYNPAVYGRSDGGEFTVERATTP
jgi:hypothetical protein